MIQADKKAHLLMGFLLVIGTVFTPLQAMCACAAMAFGKEVYDLVSGKGTPEFLDFAATVIGGIAALGVTYVL